MLYNIYDRAKRINISAVLGEKDTYKVQGTIRGKRMNKYMTEQEFNAFRLELKQDIDVEDI
jgi:hypothetical protein